MKFRQVIMIVWVCKWHCQLLHGLFFCLSYYIVLYYILKQVHEIFNMVKDPKSSWVISTQFFFPLCSIIVLNSILQYYINYKQPIWVLHCGGLLLTLGALSRFLGRLRKKNTWKEYTLSVTYHIVIINLYDLVW